ncbi:MAG: hypothetical protein QF926_11250 [Alphaproteobacteria bacterium]|nr:hypothetical protein [Alphaproteobacteria bacterium]
MPVRPGDNMRAEITVDAKRDASKGVRDVLEVTTGSSIGAPSSRSSFKPPC